MPFEIPNAADAFDPNQAEPDKVDIDILVEALGGNGVISGCFVDALTSAGIAVRVDPGIVAIDGAEVEIDGGDLALSPAESNPRFDLIVAVIDTGTGIQVVEGAASADPVFPALPANTVALAAVLVPADAVETIDAHIVDKRCFVRGPVASIAEGGTGAGDAPTALDNLGAYPASNPAGYTDNVGTVTSVDVGVPTGLEVSGGPVTTFGTITITLADGYSIPTITKQGEWDTAYSERNQWDGGATGLTAATGRASLGLVIGTDVQAYSAKLAAIAALAVTDGNIIVGDGTTFVAESGATARASLGLTIGTHVQAQDSDLSAIAGLSSTGLIVRTGSGTASARTITGTANEVTLSNGDGVSGNPTISLPAALTFTGKTITGGTFASPAAITGLPDPSNAQDAATKAYVDSVAAGLDVKGSVKCATTANITLSGEQTIDGVTTSASRVLVKNQSTTSQNGIYVSAAGAWSRATDLDNWSEVPGSFVFVEEGTTNGDTGWVCTANTGGTIGSTSMPWSQFAGAGTYSATGGITLTGTQFSLTDGGTTNAKLANMATNTIKARVTTGTGSPEDVAIAANQFLARSSSGQLGAKTLTDFGFSLIDDANAATARTTLGATTVGGNLFLLANPSAITFLRVNADNTVTARSAANFLTDIGAPSTTGSGASGTWGISISGNAATVTNGVYTTGSYANPAWITALAGSKLTGAYTAAGLTMATARLLGRTTASTGAAEEISIGSGLSLSGGVLSVNDGIYRKNRIVDGAFQFNSAEPATNADDTYANDTWYVLTQSNDIAVSALSDVEDGLPKMVRLTQSNMTAQRMGYAQIIEGNNCKDLRGKTVTFRVGRYRNSNPAAVRFAVLEWTGTEDAVTSDVVNDWTSSNYTPGNFFLGSNLTVSGVAAATPSAATLTTGPELTVTLGSSFNNLIVFVWTEGAAAQNSTLDLGKAQIELSSFATAFEWLPYTQVQNLCERYLPVFNSGGTASIFGFGGCNSTTRAVVQYLPKVKMRVPPTGITVSNGTHFTVSSAGVNTPCSSVSFNISQHPNILLINFDVASGLTAGRAAFSYANNASGKIIVTGCQL